MYSACKILIIEDSEDDFELYQRIIQKNFRSQIEYFPSAENALRHLTEESHFDLALIDYNLPGMNGIEFLKALNEKKLKLECPVIALTGQGSEEIVLKFVKLGVEDYLQKNLINAQSLSMAIENAMQKYVNQKNEADKQKELLFFAHTLAHDLKSPLGRLQAYSKLVQINPSKQEDYINHLQENANYLMEFIDKLLMYAEYGRLEIEQEEVDLNDVLQKSIENLEMDIAKCHAHIHITDNLPKVHGSSISLVQMFQNLISNSMKYCTIQPEIDIHATLEDQEVTVSLIDNGIGIPKKEMSKIFKPFARLENKLDVSGTGLGLALVKNIVDQHHGRIKIVPRKEGGTQFDVTLPI